MSACYCIVLLSTPEALLRAPIVCLVTCLPSACALWVQGNAVAFCPIRPPGQLDSFAALHAQPHMLIGHWPHLPGTVSARAAGAAASPGGGGHRRCMPGTRRLQQVDWGSQTWATSVQLKLQQSRHSMAGLPARESRSAGRSSVELRLRHLPVQLSTVRSHVGLPRASQVAGCTADPFAARSCPLLPRGALWWSLPECVSLGVGEGRGCACRQPATVFSLHSHQPMPAVPAGSTSNMASSPGSWSAPAEEKPASGLGSGSEEEPAAAGAGAVSDNDGPEGAVAPGCLALAAAAGDLRRVRALLAAGADVEEPGVVASNAPLHLAASEGHERVVEALLAAGADPQALTVYGCTPLMLAAGRGQVACFQPPLAAGADIEAQDDDKGWTCLHHWAAWVAQYPGNERALHALRTLLDAGCAVWVESDTGTALEMLLREHLSYAQKPDLPLTQMPEMVR